MSAIRPWNAKHGNAVARVGFGVVFRGSPASGQVRELAELHPEFKESYPRMRVLTKGWHLPNGADLPSLAGVTFDNDPATEETLCAIRLAPRQIKGEYALSVVRSDYSGWDAMWNDTVRRIFYTCLSTVLGSSSVLRLDLNFLDRFVWTGDPKGFRLGEVFRPDIAGWLSVGISPSGTAYTVLKQGKEDRGTQYELSGAVGVEVAPPKQPEADGGLWVDLILDQRQEIPEGVADVNGKTLTSNDTLGKQMDAMHGRCKKILGCLLNDDMRAAIKAGD